MDACHDGECHQGVHAEGQRDQQGNANGSGQPGNGTEYDAADQAEGHPDHNIELKYGAKRIQ